MNIQTLIVIIIITIFVVRAILYMIKNSDHCVGCGNKCCDKCMHSKI